MVGRPATWAITDSVNGVLLGGQDTRTNALFGQVIKLILTVVQTNYRYGKDRADDGGGRSLGELKLGWIREIGWHEGSYRHRWGVFSGITKHTIEIHFEN